MKQSKAEKTVSGDDPALILAIIAMVYLSCWAAWSFAHEQIAMGYVYIRYCQLWLFRVIGEFVDLPIVTPLNNWVQTMCQPDGIWSLCYRDFSTIQWDDISSSAIMMNVVCTLLTVFLCVRMFIRVNGTHPKLLFTKKHNIKSFVEENKKLYPHLRVFGALNLIDEPLDHPIFGMSLTSRQFVFKHRLITGWKDLGDGSWKPTLDREAATRAFRRQLGRHWTKSGDLSPGETLLVAVAMPRVAATDSSLDEATFEAAMKDCNDLIKWCWAQFSPPSPTKKKNNKDNPLDPMAWLTPTIDLTYPREIIAKYISHKEVKNIIHSHAFNRTIIFAMYMQARRLGVLQPAEMRWLRFFDRELWYCLETIGRLAGFAEAGGVLSHYLYEVKSRSALAEPQLDKAVNGLELAITSFKFLLDDKERYASGGM